MSDPFILGIEGTAHTLGLGLMRGESIIADVRCEYQPTVGGIHPREASQFLGESISEALHEIFVQGQIGPEKLDYVAFSRGPGLGPCLRTTATFSRALSIFLSIPLIGVNHCVAHVEIGRLLTAAEDPLCLYVSGGNTQIIAYSGQRYRVLGETLDIAVGNALDSLGRFLGLPHPGGPLIEKYAQNGKELLPLPYVVKGMNLSFSGLVTAAKRASEAGASLEDVCFSIQEISFGMLAEVTERALVQKSRVKIRTYDSIEVMKKLEPLYRLKRNKLVE